MTKNEWLQIHELVGALMEVYNELGRGMAEPIYQEAFAKELTHRSIPFEREKILRTYYKGEPLEKVYQADFYSDGVVIEMKSVEEITKEHRAQLFNYLRITKQDRGILVNYGERKLHCERYLYNEETDRFVLISKDNYKEYIEDI